MTAPNDKPSAEAIEAAQDWLSRSRTGMYTEALAQLLDAYAAERVRGTRYNFLFWSKRLLSESDEAQNCGDHCRNSCRWCGLRNAVAEAEEQP